MVPESFAMSRVLAALWFTGLVCQPKPASSRICAMAAGPERKVQVPVLAAGVEAAKFTGSLCNVHVHGLTHHILHCQSALVGGIVVWLG